MKYCVCVLLAFLSSGILPAEEVPLEIEYGSRIALKRYRQSNEPYYVGREGWGWFAPGGLVTGFLEDYIPYVHAFGYYHDAVVDDLTGKGWNDLFANGPTMFGAYMATVYAVDGGLGNAFGITAGALVAAAGEAGATILGVANAILGSKEANGQEDGELREMAGENKIIEEMLPDGGELNTGEKRTRPKKRKVVKPSSRRHYTSRKTCDGRADCRKELSPDEIPDPDNDGYVWCEDVCEGRPNIPKDTSHTIYFGCARCGHVVRKQARKAKRMERIWTRQGKDCCWFGDSFSIKQAQSVDESGLDKNN